MVRRQRAPFVFVMVLFAAACGGGEGAASNRTSVTNAASATTSASSKAECTAATATDLTGDDARKITIVDFAFHPTCITASSASSFVVKNGDEVPHSFTIDGTQIDLVVPAGRTVEGASWGLEPGAYEFRCTFHPPLMVGTVLVS